MSMFRMRIACREDNTLTMDGAIQVLCLLGIYPDPTREKQMPWLWRPYNKALLYLVQTRWWYRYHDNLFDSPHPFWGYIYTHNPLTLSYSSKSM